MADRNEIFRIILEGRDRLSRELDTVRRSADKLDESLKKLKRNKPDDFPLFGGGRATRGPGGQFIRKEDVTLVDRMRQSVDRLNTSIAILKRNKPQEFPLFGGGRAIRGDEGRFIRVQDVTLLEKAKNRLDAIDKALVRIRTRIRRGPLVEGEEPGAGATRLIRTAAGQFARADDLSVIKRVQRELAIVGRGIRDIQVQTRQGLILGTERTIDNIRRVGTFVDNLKIKIREAVRGAGPSTRTGVDPATGRFISVENINLAQKLVRTIESGANRIVTANQKVAQSQRDIRKELTTSFRVGLDISKRTEEIIDQNIAKSREEVAQKRIDLQKKQEDEKLDLTAEEDRERKALLQRLENLREADRLTIRQLRKGIAAAKAEKDIAAKEELEDEIARIQRARRERERIEGAEFAAGFQARRAAQRIEFAGQRRAITSPDIEEVERIALEERIKLINEAESSLGRMGRRAGLAFGDIVRGAKSARSGLRDMDRDIRIVNNAFTRFGFAVGSIFKRFDQLVNLRWLFLTGILTIFFSLVTQIGTALVALAASALQAGAALGGAFLAGVAQVLPVVGLLAAVMSRFNTVLDAVKLNEKLGTKVTDNVDQIKQAAQRLSDTQYNLKRAIEAVGEAQRGVIEANDDLKDSYKDVRDATKALAEAKIQAAKDIVDANLEEKDAALSLQEAELGVLQAKIRLREEEEKQRAGGGDADEARAALKEAQERLRIAREQGDQSEISSAQQQVTLAQQNLNSILDQVDSAKTDLKDAELGVKRATLTVEQARVRNRRAQQDAKTAREEGVAGSDVVKSAQEQLKQAIESVSNAQHNVLLANRNVRDSLHAVAVAQREVADARKEEADARKGQTKADTEAQKAFADLSPAEKKLFNALKRLRKIFKDVFVGSSERDGILGPITEALARFADTLTNLLLDPKIQKAARQLANAIADALDEFRKFVGSAEFKDALIFFTVRAADNIPRLVQGLLNLAKVFLEIAKAATPIFDRLLAGAVGITGTLRRITSQRGEVRRPEEGGPGAGIATIRESGLDKFLASGEEHLDAWIRLSAAIIKLISAIADSPAAGAGTTLIGSLTEKLNEFAKFIEENPEKVQEFFDNAVASIENLARVLGRLGAALVVAFSSKEFTDFAEFISEIIIPGLILFIFTLGKVSSALLFLLDLPIVGDIAKWALTILVAEKAFNKVFPATQKFTNAIKELIKFGTRAARVLLAPGGIRAALDAIRFQIGKTIEATKTLGTNLLNLAQRWARAAATGANRAKDAFINMATAAGRAAKAVGVTLFSAMRRLAIFIAGQFIAALRLLRLNIRLLVASTGIGALIVAGLLLIENWDKVKAAAKFLANFLVDKFKAIVNWIKENWKKVLIGLLLLPFAPAGLLILGILKFKDRILGIFTGIKDGIINRFKAAIDWIREKLSALGDWVSNKLKKIPLIGRFFGGDDEDKKPVVIQVELTPKAKAAAERIPDRKATGGIIPGQGVLDSVPALLTPGEWVLNVEQQKRLATVLGVTMQQVRAMVFGTNSTTPPRTGTFGAGRGAGGTAAAKRSKTNLPGGLSRGTPRRVINYADFNLVQQEDEDGNTVWFLELANGTFGQVTARDAEKIQSTRGTWIPGYVKRSTAGFNQNIKSIAVPPGVKFALGGIVGSRAVQRFAEGGVVQASGHGNTSSQKNITQHFDVKTQGETDWGYVMRLGAIHAQESF